MGRPQETMRLLLGGGLLGWGSREDGFVSAGAGEHDGERDGDDHEEYRAPCGELGEQVGRAARAKGRLRTLAAEGTGEVSGFALLQQHNSDQEQTDDDVNDNQKDEHGDIIESLKMQV
jgi:hypothetical protein